MSDPAFETIDRLVMGCCHASQNFLGRLCDELVYENDVAARLRAEGASQVNTQVPVTVTHQTFLKTYRLDLVVEEMIYELKTVERLAAEHDTQAIHYAVMMGTDRVKLINFRSTRVEGRLLRSPMWRVDRQQFALSEERWQPLSEQCSTLLARLTSLLGDWGAFLESRLYEEALIELSGGKEHCLRRVRLVRDGIELGTHRFACHSTDVAFVLTSLSKSPAAHELQLKRLLRCTSLRGLQWFNLDHAELQLISLCNEERQ